MSNITLFGATNYRNEMRKFGIKVDDRRRHMYIIGKTGMGKSTILENMIIDDIRAGKGIALVDPHGDLAEKVLEFIPEERINDVVYLNPADMDYPIAFNVIEQVDQNQRHLVASGLIGVFKKLWAESWGPRLEYTLRNAILAVLDYEGATLLAVVRMLSDKEFRKEVILQIQDPVVKAFWTKEFASYADKFANEAVAPIQNKVGQFLSTAIIRNIVGQVKSSINIRNIMDERKILIMNLSKGRIGEDNMQLLGAMMITKIQLAAMSRVDIPEETRKDFYLYVDEFQNFATESFAGILSEARKYRLNLIMAHQYIEQLDETVKNAVFGNVGSLVVFRVGAADAETLVTEFTPTFAEEDIVNIPKHEFYTKLMIDGVSSDPFSAKGLPPKDASEKTNIVEKIIEASREKYAQNRLIVEEKIIKWHESASDREEASKKPAERTYNPQANNNSNNNYNSQPRPREDYESQAPQAFKPQGQGFAPNNNYNNSNQNFNSNSNSNYNPRPARQDFNQTPTPRFKAPPINNNPPAINPATSKPRVETPRISSNNSVDSQVKVKPQEENLHACSNCGKQIRISFVPDGLRPIYCKDCLLKKNELKKNEELLRVKKKQDELEKLKTEETRFEPKEKLKLNLGLKPQKEIPKVIPDEMSLSDALLHSPFPFRGAKNTSNSTHREAKINPIQEITAPKHPIEPPKPKEEGELSEGEEIKF